MNDVLTHWLWGRHYNITVFLATQNAKAWHQSFVVIATMFHLRQFNQPMLDTLSEDYCIYHFKRISKRCPGPLTDNYGSIVVKLRVTSTNNLADIYQTTSVITGQTSHQVDILLDAKRVTNLLPSQTT